MCTLGITQINSEIWQKMHDPFWNLLRNFLHPLGIRVSTPKMLAILFLSSMLAVNGDTWRRGNYTQVEIDLVNTSYHVIVGDAPPLVGVIRGPDTATAIFAKSNGNDAVLGPFDRLSLLAAVETSASSPLLLASVTYYPKADAFIWTRRYHGGNFPEIMLPAFVLEGKDQTWTTMSWSHGGMVSGASGGTPRQWIEQHGFRQANQQIAGEAFGGPVFLWSNDSSPSPALGLSALNHFTANSLFVIGNENKNSSNPSGQTPCNRGDQTCLLCGAAFNATSVPSNTDLSILLVGRPGLTRTTRALGAILRRVHNTTRLRGLNVEALSYWCVLCCVLCSRARW